MGFNWKTYCMASVMQSRRCSAMPRQMPSLSRSSSLSSDIMILVWVVAKVCSQRRAIFTLQPNIYMLHYYMIKIALLTSSLCLVAIWTARWLAGLYIQGVSDQLLVALSSHRLRTKRFVTCYKEKKYLYHYHTKLKLTSLLLILAMQSLHQ